MARRKGRKMKMDFRSALILGAGLSVGAALGGLLASLGTLAAEAITTSMMGGGGTRQLNGGAAPAAPAPAPGYANGAARAATYRR